MGEMLKVRYVAEGHRAGLTQGKTYDAVISRDNEQIIIITDEFGDEYGYPVSEFEIVRDRRCREVHC